MTLAFSIKGDGGFAELDAWLANAPAVAGVGAEAAIKEIGQWVFDESQRLVPVDTGVLKATGSLQFEGGGFDTVAVISYFIFYAIYVHEDLTKHHPNGQAKFIEDPMRRVGQFAGALVAERVSSALRGPRF